MRRRGNSRAVIPIIANVLLVEMVVAAGSILFAFRPALPPQPSAIYYQAETGPGEPTWGDGSDCKTVNGVQSCAVLPSLDIILTASSPPNVLVSSLYFYLFCNGTVYLSGTLSQITWTPGAAQPAAPLTSPAPPLPPGASTPQLGHCGTYTPPAAAFNRLVYFHQLVPGAATVQTGDMIVLYTHTFEPPNCPNPQYKNGVLVACDDDFHGAPTWCYDVQGACNIDLIYGGPPTVSLLQIPLYGLSS